jgi:glycosyltransferase involved in cell wall biosynthesis
MKKLLIVTYYWPPLGGGGVQRWLKMSKYLREFGWEPVILTTEGAETGMIDESLLSEVVEGTQVYHVPIWEPFSLYKRFLGKNKDERMYSGFLSDSEESSNWKKELSLWIRGNVFIPDAKRFWIGPASKKLRWILRNEKIDAIVSTGPPHTTHLIAMKGRGSRNIPWIADFRDPWTNIDFYEKLKLSKWADKKHHRLEKRVLRTASAVVTVTWSWAEDFFNDSGVRPEVITNGFDPADFEQKPSVLDSKFSLAHIGSLNPDRDPTVLWQALSELKQEIAGFEKDLEIKFIGPVDGQVYQSIRSFELEGSVNDLGSMPHKQVMPLMMRSQILLLLVNNTANVSGIIPGKLYEYLGSRRPVLCIGPEHNDSVRVVRETGGGAAIGYDQVNEMKAYITTSYDAYKKGQLNSRSEGIERFSRQKLAGDYGQLLDRLCEGTDHD